MRDIKKIREKVKKGIFERNGKYLASHGYYQNEESKLKIYEDYIVKLSDKQYSQLPVFDIIHGKFDSVIPKTKGKTTIFINENLPIIKVALNYGLKIKNNKMVCPFHNDKDPSLVFYPHTNSFHCFSCKASGDVITFIQKMEDL